MLRIVVHNERGYQGHAHVRPLTVLVIMSTQIMRGDWCSIYATLRKKKGTGKNETQEGSRDGEGGRGRVHKILSMDTKRAALKDDRFEFIDDHRQRRRGLLTSMTRDGKKKKMIAR